MLDSFEQGLYSISSLKRIGFKPIAEAAILLLFQRGQCWCSGSKLQINFMLGKLKAANAAASSFLKDYSALQPEKQQD